MNAQPAPATEADIAKPVAFDWADPFFFAEQLDEEKDLSAELGISDVLRFNLPVKHDRS